VILVSLKNEERRIGERAETLRQTNAKRRIGKKAEVLRKANEVSEERRISVIQVQVLHEVVRKDESRDLVREKNLRRRRAGQRRPKILHLTKPTFRLKTKG